jgi:hypothetical protein
VSHDTPENHAKVTGKDGKQYPAKAKAKAKAKTSPGRVLSSDPIQEPCTDCENPAEL